MEWYVSVLKRYYDFEGRAHRQEYWMFFAINLAIAMTISIVERVIGIAGYLSLLYALAVLCPALGVGVRRLHDTNRSGWFMLIALVPILGALALIYLLAQPGQSSQNQFGAVPEAA